MTTINANGKVVFGATVKIVDEDSGEEVTYQIVGEDEADIKSGMISDQLADRPRLDRQGGRRCRHGRHAGRYQGIRDHRSALYLGAHLAPNIS